MRQEIRLGTVGANGRDGDDNRTAFKKINEMTAELYIESGSNANGNFTKLPDGTAMAWGEISIPSVGIASPNGTGAFNSLAQSFRPMPITFVGPTCIDARVITADSSVWLGYPNKDGLFYVFATTAGTRDIIVQWRAIGKWK